MPLPPHTHTRFPDYVPTLGSDLYPLHCADPTVPQFYWLPDWFLCCWFPGLFYLAGPTDLPYLYCMYSGTYTHLWFVDSPPTVIPHVTTYHHTGLPGWC